MQRVGHSQGCIQTWQHAYDHDNSTSIWSESHVGSQWLNQWMINMLLPLTGGERGRGVLPRPRAGPPGSHAGVTRGRHLVTGRSDGGQQPHQPHRQVGPDSAMPRYQTPSRLRAERKQAKQLKLRWEGCSSWCTFCMVCCGVCSAAVAAGASAMARAQLRRAVAAAAGAKLWAGCSAMGCPCKQTPWLQGPRRLLPWMQVAAVSTDSSPAPTSHTSNTC